MKLLASGRSADVYALGDGRVACKYRDGWSAEYEAVVMAHLGGLGYPPSEMFSVSGAEIVMERIDGPGSAEVIAARSVTAEVAADASTHSRDWSQRRCHCSRATPQYRPT